MSSTSYMNCWAFDIDGVLVDSRYAVKAAYKHVGIDMPDSAWGLPWQDWLPKLTPNVDATRRGKSEAYLSLIREGALDVLPMAQLARQLEGSDCRVAYVTSSSDPSATAILKSLSLDHTCLLGTNLQPVERATKLARWSDWGVYVDDRPEGIAIARDAGWSFFNTTFIREP